MSELKKLELIDPANGFYAVRWNVNKLENGQIKYDQKVVKHKPSIQEVKSIIIDGFNKECTKSILNDLVWKGHNVFLDEETQRNINLICGSALVDSSVLPVTLKLGLSDDTEYYTFTSLEELKDFYICVTKHISDCLKRCWDKKSNLNLEEYK